jgi:alpha-N-arabinofuranosidase
MIVDGGVDLCKKPIWIEAPHIYKRNGKYYLMCAEGGTGGWHSEVIFISDSPKGPYVPAPSNPILTQRHFPADRPNKVDWAGHADLVEGLMGNSTACFWLCVRTKKSYVNTGRETFILPVDWSGTFLCSKMAWCLWSQNSKCQKVLKNKTGKDGFLPNGNFTFSDNFAAAIPDYRWIGCVDPVRILSQLPKTGFLFSLSG